MKNTIPAIILIVLLVTSCNAPSRDGIIELPLTYQKGYGPFKPAMGGIGFQLRGTDNPWLKTTPEYTGIPTDWTDTIVALFNLNMTQFVYQNYREGKITEEFYQNLRSSWDWFPDESELSDTPVKCFVGILRGNTPDGERKYIVDRNNNLDFSDDEAFTLTPQPHDNKQSDSLDHYAIPIKYERIFNGRVQEEETYLMMQIMENMQSIVFANVVQYATAELGKNKLGILSSNFTDFSFQRLSVSIIPADLAEGEYLDWSASYQKNEYLENDGALYKILGVDRNRDVLCLEKISKQRHELESPQPGFKAFGITGQEFTSKDSISLADFKGKYLFIDFWATWCGPCISEFPGLKEIYANTDRSRFDILGIVGESDAESLRKSIETNNISWPQIMSTDDNPITKTYSISAYPTTLLLGPDRIIIERNLRGSELSDKLRELGVLE